MSIPSVSRIPAERLLAMPIRPITSARAPWLPGGPNDFYSEADYWWPSPETPETPYKKRDGESNPDCFNRHRKLLMWMCFELARWVKGYEEEGAQRLLDRIVLLLRTWFIEPSTAMSPHLNYAQAVRGWIPGRSYGIIDTLHLAEGAVALKLILHELPQDVSDGVLCWFRSYLEWMTESAPGKTERAASNNHSVCWYLQAASFSLLLDDKARLQEYRKDFKTTLLLQLAGDGSFPQELARTKPYGYSLFQFEVMTGLALLLSTPDENFFRVRNDAGADLAKAAEWLFPYLESPETWPLPKDVLFAECWPAKQSGLLLAWYFTGEKKYFELWKKLDHKRLCFEYFRNFPVKTPELWLRLTEKIHSGKAGKKRNSLT